MKVGNEITSKIPHNDTAITRHKRLNVYIQYGIRVLIDHLEVFAIGVKYDGVYGNIIEYSKTIVSIISKHLIRVKHIPIVFAGKK